MAEAVADTNELAPAIAELTKAVKALQDQGVSQDEILKKLATPENNLRFTGSGFSYLEQERIHKALAAYDDDRIFESPYRGRIGSMPKGYQPHESWDSKGGLGQFIREGVASHCQDIGGDMTRRSEFGKKYHDMFKGCTPEIQQLAGITKAVQGMSEGVGSDGGFTVLPQFASGIMERMYSNNLLSKTDGYTVTGNSMIFHASAETSRATGSRGGGIQAYMVPEGGSVTKSKPTLRRVGLRLVKVAVVVYLTNELIQDSGAAIEQYVTRQAAQEISFTVGNQLFRGLGGVGAPLGFLNSPALLTIAAETSQPAATIWTENLDKMHARRLNVGGASYEWYTNQDTAPQLDQLIQAVGTGGIPLNRPGNSINTSPVQPLKGLPRNDVEFAATLGTAGDISLVDFGQMISLTKGGISQESSMHLEFLTDQLAVRFIYRFDARPWDASAITPFQGTNTQSPFIVLATR